MLPSIKLEGILCCINSRCLWVLIDLHNSAISLRKKLPSFFEYPPCVSTYLWIDPSIHPSIQTSICHICPIYLCFLSIYASYPYKCVYIYVHIYIYICSGKNVSVCQREVSTPRMPMQQFLLAQIMTFFSPH
jgi:hypothetical protein